MFDADPLLPLREAARLVPGARGPSTSGRLRRWIVAGHRGVRLQAVQTPDRTWHTRASWVLAFLDAITQRPVIVLPERKASPGHLAAVAELRARGIL